MACLSCFGIMDDILSLALESSGISSTESKNEESLPPNGSSPPSNTLDFGFLLAGIPPSSSEHSKSVQNPPVELNPDDSKSRLSASEVLDAVVNDREGETMDTTVKDEFEALLQDIGYSEFPDKEPTPAVPTTVSTLVHKNTTSLDNTLDSSSVDHTLDSVLSDILGDSNPHTKPVISPVVTVSTTASSLPPGVLATLTALPSSVKQISVSPNPGVSVMSPLTVSLMASAAVSVQKSKTFSLTTPSVAGVKGLPMRSISVPTGVGCVCVLFACVLFTLCRLLVYSECVGMAGNFIVHYGSGLYRIHSAGVRSA